MASALQEIKNEWCGQEPNIVVLVVFSTDLMYESGVSMGKKGSDLSITIPQNTTKK